MITTTVLHTSKPAERVITAQFLNYAGLPNVKNYFVKAGKIA